MAGKLLYAYDATNKVWIPLQVDTNGYVKVDMSNIKLNDLADVSVATPTNGHVIYWDNATSLWKAKAHADLTTGVHGAGANYLALAPATSHLVRTFTKGWTSGKLLKGAGVDADPTEISGWEKIAEVIAGSNLDYVDFTNLDINTDKSYIFTFNIKNPTATTGGYNLTRNGDNTITNYRHQFMNASGTALSAARENAAHAAYIPAGNAQTSVGFVFRDPDGYMHAFNFFDYGRATSIAFTVRFINSINPTANITSLRLTAPVAEAIGAGSILSLYKPRTA